MCVIDHAIFVCDYILRHLLGASVKCCDRVGKSVNAHARVSLTSVGCAASLHFAPGSGK